ncbi:hypothetical protein Rumeso_00926 [Rubellimicrobium mesophilum DSM 19309]|uniref:Uncharacterized protein n=1 Tax=Rubellimicrobium mesophilum DSM 19309 TaxID=442562 RepID=A0A017HT06_9RHOB|nr:hypothetical protein Rumeso_00926 [Rubellimicrobium mesophilum DSM 19309]
MAEVGGSLVGYAASCPPAQTPFGLRRMYLQHLYVDRKRCFQATAVRADGLG